MVEKIVIDGVEISLRDPVPNMMNSLGYAFLIDHVINSWLHMKQENSVYKMYCKSKMHQEDLIITPNIGSDQEIEYMGSALLSAIFNGGTCVLVEANRMNEKCWASLASLLDDRRYVESVVAGIKIHAHDDFRFLAYIIDEPSTVIPKFIKSRLKPAIPVDSQDYKQLLTMVKSNVPIATENIIETEIMSLWSLK